MNLKFTSPLIFSALLFSSSLQAKETNITRFKPDTTLVYKTFDKAKDLKLYIFEPEIKQENQACIIFFFGGGWKTGKAKQFYAQAHHLAQKGILAISAEYRTKTSHNTTPHDAVDDAKSVISWVRANATTLGIDSNKIIAAGGSAGGHLAVCTGIFTTADHYKSAPNAMILYNPVLDTTANGYGSGSFGINKTQLSPCHHIRKGIVPTLVLHGTADSTVPFENAVRFNQLMQDAGNDSTLISYDGANHGFFNHRSFSKKSNNKHFLETMKATENFLRRLKFLTEK